MDDSPWGHKRVRHDLATKQQQISALLPNKSFAVFYRNIGDLQYILFIFFSITLFQDIEYINNSLCCRVVV